MKRIFVWPILALTLAVPRSEAADDPARPFLGRWDVTLKTPDRSYPSWLDIETADGKLKVRMVGRWGHARWLPQAEIVGDRIRFVSPKEDEGYKNTDMVFEGQRVGNELRGETHGPDGTLWTWRAEPAPALDRATPPQWGRPVTLFHGRDLYGWSPTSAAKPTWSVAEGTLVSAGDGADLRSDATFGDFKLHVEFNCAKGANSGVYLRGRYEVQIEDDAVPENETMRTGAVYGFLAPNPPTARVPGTWHSYDITLVGRRVTVVLDGRTLIDGKDIPGITGGALDSHEALPGPIVLQGSETGRVAFRNIVVTPAK